MTATVTASSLVRVPTDDPSAQNGALSTVPGVSRQLSCITLGEITSLIVVVRVTRSDSWISTSCILRNEWADALVEAVRGAIPKPLLYRQFRHLTQ